MCKECEKRGTVMTVAPLKKHFGSISSTNIKELCHWFRTKNVEIITLHFITEDITVTIGLEREIEILEKALMLPCYAPLQYEKLKEIMKELAQ